LDHPGESSGKSTDFILTVLSGRLDGHVTGGYLLSYPYEIDQGTSEITGKEEEKDGSQDQEYRADGNDYIPGKIA
jgi:hypothetical protein